MRGALRWVVLATIRAVFAVAGVGVWLLVAWQVIVVGVVAGPHDLMAVAVAGVASGLALLVTHELGHAAAMWAVGAPLVSLTLVVVRLDWRSGRLAVVPNTRLLGPAAVAWCAATGAGRWQVAAIVAAGPAANLALAGLCLVAAQAANPGPSADIPVAARSAWRDVAVVWPWCRGST
ncbi:hypothetical protein R5W24_006405 [Gemmata sp. JC717]|uniref:site-2 protease family protein n=1 Tax=Gemmata algarum TaxID=2975278 RepID=UPI0021BA7D6B|nr:site-2 protease family protein [Gemmata algarum]MDY3557217.1 hypothetical protein [Gemmata algarum]